MASFKKRDGGIQVSIRRKGYQPIYRTFDDTRQGEQDAEQWAEDIELQIKHGRHQNQNNTGSTPLREALERYRREVTPLKKPSGAKKENTRIIALCKIPLTDRAMDQVTSMLIASYRDEMLDADYKASTINNNLAILSRCYNVAATEWGLAVQNPVKGVRRPRQGEGRDRRFKEGEEELILSYLREPFKSMVVLLLETAMRRGELCRIEWRDIKLNERYLILRETKNSEARSVPLSTKAVRVLSGLPRNIDGKVFKIHPDTLSHAVLDACRANDIHDFHTHDLRHEATSRLFEMGVFNIMEIASITGHKDLKMLKRYTHFEASSLAAKLG